MADNENALVLPIAGQVDLSPVGERLAAATRTSQEQSLAIGALAEAHRVQSATLRDALDKIAGLEQSLADQAAEFERRIAQIKTPTPTEINLLDVGVRLNDPKMDNGVPINAILRRLGGNGGNEAGWLNTSLYLPGGACYFYTPIETTRKTSALRIRSNGLTHALNENHYYSPNPQAMGGPVGRLVYMGESPVAVRLHSLGDIWDGVVLQRGMLPNKRTLPTRDGSIGIELAGDEQPPVGKAEFRSIALLGFDCGIHATGTSGESHADESEVGFGWIQDCRTAFRSTGVQVTCWHFRTLKVAGLCETVFDFQRGGGMLCGQLSLMAKALVLNLREPTENFASYRINYLKADGAVPGWRLVNVSERAWGLLLDVWGEIGKGAVPSADAVIVRGPAGRQFLNIDLVDGNTAAPWDWKKYARLEVTR